MMMPVVEAFDRQLLGVTVINGRRISVPFTAPGDVVEIRRWCRKKGRLVATEYEVIKESELRIEPKCPNFGKCGGCLLQHLPYEEQVRLKREILSSVLDTDVDVLPSPVVYGHRNRIDMVVSTKGIGFRRFGTWWNVVDVDECPVFGASSRRVVRSLKEFIASSPVPPKELLYNIRKNSGFLRYVVLREGKFTGELMVNIVTSEGRLPEDFPDYFRYATSVYWSVNRTKSDVSYGDVEAFWGERFIREKVRGVTYMIHPNSFFQTNSYQLGNLLDTVDGMIDGGRILDMYSGIGTFSVFLAKRGLEVEGIDVNPFSIEMARLNAKENDVNAKFRTRSDREYIDLSKFDSVIVDPPRPGLHPRFRKLLTHDGPETLVYVSCNPSTLKDDLGELRSVYKVEDMVGVDMFPHTPHVETVVKLSK